MDAAHHDCFTVGCESMQRTLEVTQMIAGDWFATQAGRGVSKGDGICLFICLLDE